MERKIFNFFLSFSLVESTSVTSRTVVRTEVTTLTSTTLEGDVDDDSGEQIVTRITRQTITKRPTVLSAEFERSLDTENDDEVGRTSSLVTISPSSPSMQSLQSLVAKMTPEPAVTTYTSIGPDVTFDNSDDETVVTKVTMTTTVVSHSPGPLTAIAGGEESCHHFRGHSPSHAQFATFVTENLGGEAAVLTEAELEGTLDVTRTESRTEDVTIRRETQTFTTEPFADQEVITTVTKSTVVMHKSPEGSMLTLREGPTIEEVTGHESSSAMQAGDDWLGQEHDTAKPEHFKCDFPPQTGKTVDEAGSEKFVCNFPPESVEDRTGETSPSGNLATAPEKFECHFPPPSAAESAPGRFSVTAEEVDSELEELESHHEVKVGETVERERGESAQSYLKEENEIQAPKLLPSTSTSMPEISGAAGLQPEESTLASATGEGRGSEMSNISMSSGRETSESSRPESACSTESDKTLMSPGSRQESSLSEYLSARGESPVPSMASSYRTAEGGRGLSSEYDTAATDFSSTPYQTAGEGSTPGSRHLSAVGSPVGPVSDREEGEALGEPDEAAMQTSAEIASLAQQVVQEFGQSRGKRGENLVLN